MNPQFPIYIVSKGRSDTRFTAASLDQMGVPYLMVVEKQERDLYRRATPEPNRVLILDTRYQDQYDTFDDLGSTKGKGPGPARNFAWDHSVAHGAAWHWVMDDNINRFYRLHLNKRVPLGDGTGLRAMEDFVLRYENVAMAGPFYTSFAPEVHKLPPFILNTRIYSCNLIRNDVPFRWRGRYNEDTDLSLRMLKAGWCTVQFYAFLQNKLATQTVKGGNAAEFYDKEGTLAKSKMQVAMHPDVSRLVMKYGRPHHHVNYKGFRQKLIRKRDVEIDTAETYGLRLIKV